MTKAEILQLAQQSKLELTEDELTKLEAEINKDLQFVNKIKESSMDPAIVHKTMVTIGDLRRDVVMPSLPRDEILKKGHKSDGEYFVVPQVVE